MGDAAIQSCLSELHIPLHVVTQTPRRFVPHKVMSIASEWKSKHIFANIEYGVDELRRDIAILNLCKQSGMSCVFTSDKCIVEPGTLKTKQDKPYTVYSPWLKNWLPTLHNHPEYLEESPPPARNSETIRESPTFSVLFSTRVPTSVDGFECDDKEKMEELWPAGTDAASEVLRLLPFTEHHSDRPTGVTEIPVHKRTQVPGRRFFSFV